MEDKLISKSTTNSGNYEYLYRVTNRTQKFPKTFRRTLTTKYSMFLSVTNNAQEIAKDLFFLFFFKLRQ